MRNVVAHGAGEGKVALLEHAPELIKNGIFLDTTHDKAGKTSHIFAAKAVVDGELRTIGIVVHQDEFGKRYYDHAIRLNEMDLRAETIARKSDTTVPNPPDDPNSVYNILKKHLGVNSEAKKVSTAGG